MQKSLLVFCFLLLCACFYAQNTIPLESVVSSETAAALRLDGKVERILYRDGQFVPSLNPNSELGNKCAELMSNKTPALAVEYLALLPKKSARDAGAEIPRISRILRSVSSLQGILYFSHSSKKRKVLYEESYTIQSIKDKTRIADPTEGSADGKVLYALQKDSTFGRVCYEYSYFETGSETAFTMRNIDPLKLAFIQVIDSSELNNCLLISDLGDSLLVYAVLAADFAAIAAIENKVVSSFSARSDAIFEWFTDMYLSGTE